MSATQFLFFEHSHLGKVKILFWFFNGLIEIRMYIIQFGEKTGAFHFRFKDCEYVINITNIKFWTNVLDCKYFYSCLQTNQLNSNGAKGEPSLLQSFVIVMEYRIGT